jgi:PAS domain-containing protein
MEQLQEDGYIRYEDMPLETKQGKCVEVEFVSNSYMVGDRKVIQCNIRDITDRKWAEDAARISAERFRFLAESMPLMIFTAKPNGDIDYVNRQLTEFTGLSSEEGWKRAHADGATRSRVVSRSSSRPAFAAATASIAGT